MRELVYWLRKRDLISVEPFVVVVAASHVVVVDAKVSAGMAGDGRVGAARDDKNGVSSVAVAGILVIDKHITRTDVGRRRLVVAADTGPAVDIGKAVAKALGSDFLLATRIATARISLVKIFVATSKKALGNKVGTVTTVAAVAAVLLTVVRPRSAGLVTTVAVVVGTVPPGLGICNRSITIIGSCTSCKSKESNNSLHESIKETKKREKGKESKNLKRISYEKWTY